MTDSTTPANPLARPAEQFHFLKSGVIWHAKAPNMWGGVSEISQRGQTVTITAEMLEASPWISRYLGDDDAQLARWGEVHIAPGPWPDGMPTYTPNSPEHAEARETARKAAWRQDTPQDVRAALAEVQAVYGPLASTSVTLNSAPSPQPRPSGKPGR